MLSLNCNLTLVDVPLSTSIPASALGVPDSLLLRTIRLSSTVRVSVLTDVCVPLTVKFPLTTTSANVMYCEPSSDLDAKFKRGQVECCPRIMKENQKKNKKKR